MEAELQKLNIDSSLVELYTLDCSDPSIGGLVYNFTPHFADGGVVNFGGTTYTSIPIMSEGWEVSASGTQPRPTLTVSNVNSVLLNAVITLGDIVGARVTRTVTMAKFLDGAPQANSNSFLRPDHYWVEQKIDHTKDIISWQLSSALDRFGTKLPRRQITRDLFPDVGRQRGAW